MLRRMAAIAGMLAICLTAMAAPPGNGVAPSGEYQVKAAFMLRFVRFVTWPAGTGPSRDRLVVAIVGDSPLSDALDAAVAAGTAHSRVEIRHGLDPDVLASGCDILFVPAEIGHIARSDHPRWKNLAWLGTRPILTIGEDDDFLDAGGIISFVIEGDRVRFAIDQARAERAGLTISSHLLRLAERR